MVAKHENLFLQNWDITTVEVEKVIDYTIVYILGPVDNRLQEFRISVRLDLILIGADVENM